MYAVKKPLSSINFRCQQSQSVAQNKNDRTAYMGRAESKQ